MDNKLVYPFVEFQVSEELEKDCLELSKDFFKRLDEIKKKYDIPTIMIGSGHTGITYNIGYSQHAGQKLNCSVELFNRNVLGK